jgi:hypothetical protein
MHQLRLFEMRVKRATVVANDYDFRIGRNHLQGKGWRGLAALAITSSRTPATVGTLVVSVHWLLQHVNDLPLVLGLLR